MQIREDGEMIACEKIYHAFELSLVCGASRVGGHAVDAKPAVFIQRQPDGV